MTYVPQAAVGSRVNGEQTSPIQPELDLQCDEAAHQGTIICARCDWSAIWGPLPWEVSSR
jgi:hypothetical protein